MFFFQFQFNTQRPNARPQPSVSRLRSLSCWTSSPLKLNTIIIESRERFMHSPQLDIGNRASRDNCVQLNSSILVTLRSIIIAPVWWSWTGRELTWWNFLVVSIPSSHTQHIAELSWNVPMRQLYVWMWKCNLRFLWKKEKKKIFVYGNWIAVARIVARICVVKEHSSWQMKEPLAHKQKNKCISSHS